MRFKQMMVILALILTSSFVNASKLKCPECGYLNESSDRYCVSCAKQIREMTDQERKFREEKNHQQSLEKYHKARVYYRKAQKTKGYREALQAWQGGGRGNACGLAAGCFA